MIRKLIKLLPYWLVMKLVRTFNASQGNLNTGYKNSGKDYAVRYFQIDGGEFVVFSEDLQEIFDKRRIYKPMSGTIGRTGCFELTRGCVFSCTFCINEFFNKIHDHKNYREKSIPNFIDEVKYFKDKYYL